MLANLRLWIARYPNLCLALLVCVMLVPFLAKPFNIDDPLFIWAAHQIHAHPANPYGFKVDWGWTAFPMWKVTENPPLTCYYLAGAAGIFGWSELALHFAFLLPAIAVILGTYRLASKFCHHPVLVAMVVLAMPGFLVSATSVMCDVPMLAGWIWAVVFWVEGLTENSARKLFAASCCMALAVMTKYYAASLIPLLAAYSLATRRPLGQWAQFLIIPLTVICAYQYITQATYGTSLLFYAGDYVRISKEVFGFSKLQHGLIALAFAGGCLAPVILFLPAWASKREVFAGLIALAIVAALICLNDILWIDFKTIQGGALTSAKIQMSFWAVGGLGVLALALGNLVRHRDPPSLLLTLWVAGTLWFAAFGNWTVNARSILPMAPAVAILIIRRFEQNNSPRPLVAGICLAASAGLALLVARADFLYSVVARECAMQVQEKFKGTPGTLWFQGHWGFQYYMASGGAHAVDFRHPDLQPGDWVAIPLYNTNVLQPDPAHTALLGTLQIAGPTWVSTWNPVVGAAFYAALRGPLPFVFGRVPLEQVSVYALQGG